MVEGNSDPSAEMLILSSSMVIKSRFNDSHTKTGVLPRIINMVKNAAYNDFLG